MEELLIRSKIKDYTVKFTEDFYFIDSLKTIENSIFIVDENVFNLYKQLFAGVSLDKIIFFRAVEENKTIESVIKLSRELLKRSVKRNTTLISIGGGITQDVTGFLASTLYRGINWVFIPTTLLAQADSCIGSKTSLNFDSYKNIIGTFYPPSIIYLSIGFLNTLDIRDIYSGFGEIIKLQLIKVKEKAELNSLADRVLKVGNLKDKTLLLNLIKDSLLVKKYYIEEDEFDYGKRNILNYGHTLGHALESVSDFKISHGLAVVIGMIFVNIIALRRKLLDKDVSGFINRNILLPHLHLDILSLRKEFFDSNSLFEKIKKDKKRTGQGLALIIPNSSFEFQKIQNLYFEEFKESLKELQNLLAIIKQNRK